MGMSVNGAGQHQLAGCIRHFFGFSGNACGNLHNFSILNAHIRPEHAGRGNHRTVFDNQIHIMYLPYSFSVQSSPVPLPAFCLYSGTSTLIPLYRQPSRGKAPV